ncbi:unnamed protein product [Prorocentrum cordatum]|uniref:Hexosyltransferase n=1 Tax=Prorocentrum cordatum TaxID=2364126 RepID=A0ABN9QD07_9DINO|nr:unnamed protein product [Polarella glacialis]
MAAAVRVACLAACACAVSGLAVGQAGEAAAPPGGAAPGRARSQGTGPDHFARCRNGRPFEDKESLEMCCASGRKRLGMLEVGAAAGPPPGAWGARKREERRQVRQAAHRTLTAEESRQRVTSCIEEGGHMEELVKTVEKGATLPLAVTAWRAYQDKLARQLLEDHPGGARETPYRILVAIAVKDAAESVDIFNFNLRRLRSNKAGDKFEFALFHHDGSNEQWAQQAWYGNNGTVVLKHLGRGCKPEFWETITPEMAAGYDYLWLLDEDLQMDFLSWDFYRTVLSTLDPVVSQPVVIGKEPGMRGTDILDLRMRGVLDDGRFTFAYETVRTDVQIPVISAKIWAAVHERIAGNDRTSAWYTDTFWDTVAELGKAECQRTGILAVNAAPLRHFNWHNLFNGTKCAKGCGAAGENCRPVSGTEARLVRQALGAAAAQDGRTETPCQIPENWTGACQVHGQSGSMPDCLQAMLQKSSRRQWNAELSFD